MKLSRTVAVPAIAACLCIWTGCKLPADLQPEQPATVHVGEVAAVRVDSARSYSAGSAGDSLKLIERGKERTTTIYVYRAVAPGHHTLVLTPREPGPDGCVSCVTLHYFITVVE
jgi:hypothetical protein